MSKLRSLVLDIRNVAGLDSWVTIIKVVSGAAVKGHVFMSKADALRIARLLGLPGIYKTRGFNRRIVWL
jgi:hypothetical protein